MRGLIRNAWVLSVVVAAVGVGCSSSSSDSGAGGSSNAGSAGRAAGGSSQGGASGGSNTSAGAGGAGTAGTSTAGATNNGGAGGTAPLGDNAGAAGDNSGAAGAQACNTLVDTAPIVNSTSTADAPPTLAQGTLQAGDYFLSAATIYNPAVTTIFEVAVTAHVSVTDQTATINTVDTAELRNTLTIEMGTPSSNPPVSLVVSCSTDPDFSAAVGKDVKGTVSYGVTGNTFSIYTSGNKALRTFTLQP